MAFVVSSTSPARRLLIRDVKAHITVSCGRPKTPHAARRIASSGGVLLQPWPGLRARRDERPQGRGPARMLVASVPLAPARAQMIRDHAVRVPTGERFLPRPSLVGRRTFSLRILLSGAVGSSNGAPSYLMRRTHHLPQHRLNLRPLPHGQGSFRPTLASVAGIDVADRAEPPGAGSTTGGAGERRCRLY